MALTLTVSCKKKKDDPGKTSSGVSTAGLNLFLKMDGNTDDASAVGSNVIKHGNPTPAADRKGNPNGSLLFNGTSDYLEVPDNVLFSGTAISISAWVKPTAFGIYTNGTATTDAYSGIFCKWDASAKRGITSIANYSRSRVSGYFADETLYDAGTTPGTFLSLNTWQHVGYVIDNNRVTLYYNGQPVATKSHSNSSGLYSASAPIEIGRTQWYPSNILMFSYFTGAMDDVRVYFRSLSDAEMNQLHSE